MTMRRKLMAVAVGLLLLASPAVARSKEASQTLAGSNQIRAVLERLYAAWSDLDPAKASPFYAKEPDLTFFDIAPMKYTGWAGPALIAALIALRHSLPVTLLSCK